MSHLVKIGETNSLPSLYSDSDDQEDAGRESKVAAALKEGKHKVNKAVVEAKVDG